MVKKTRGTCNSFYSLLVSELSVNDCWVVSLRACCSGKTLTSALAMDVFEISPVYMYGSKVL